MTALDEPTLLVVAPVVLVVVGALYVLEVWRRDGTDPVDRCWSLTFLAAVVTTFAYLAGTAPVLWWTVPLGNGSFVLALGAIWAGARARAGRRSLLRVVVASAGVVAVAALAEGPDGGPWAGGGVYLVAVAAWTALAAVELLARPGGDGRRPWEATVLGTTCAVAATFHAARAVTFLAGGGPESASFVQGFPTAVATLVNLVLVLVGAFAMMALRTRETARAAAVRFDPVLGARTLPHLVRTVAARTAAGSGGHEVRVLALECLDGPALRDAFGRAGREAARAHLVEVVLGLLPPGGAVGADPARHDEVVVVLPAAADDERWVRALRRALLDRPLLLDGDTIGLDVALGVAVGDGQDVSPLLDAARASFAAKS